MRVVDLRQKEVINICTCKRSAVRLMWNSIQKRDILPDSFFRVL